MKKLHSKMWAAVVNGEVNHASVMWLTKQIQSVELLHFTEVCISASVNHDLLPLSNKQRYLHSTETLQ